MGRKDSRLLAGLDLDVLPKPKSVEEFVGLLQNQRKLEPSQWEEFLHPKHPKEIEISEYFDVGAFKQAIQCIRDHAKKQSNIVIFGDYDADGVCATAVLWESLRELGVTAAPFLPSRFKHGYGLTEVAVNELLEMKNRPDLVITVDTGITATSAIARLIQAGIEVVLTDHHTPLDSDQPVPTHLIHSTNLCGTTVSWFVARELTPAIAGNSLDLCAIATLADQVSLRGANRSFAVHGVEALKFSKRPGLLALYDRVGLNTRFLDGRAVQFKLVPPLNAAGRMKDPLEALRLVCVRSRGTAEKLADSIVMLNDERRQKTTQMSGLAYELVQSQFTDVIALYHDEFHEGLIGLVAGNMAERLKKPVLVMSPSNSQSSVVKGSMRSIEGVNSVELLRSLSEHLDELGGHPLAGGFSLQKEKLDSFLVAVREIRLGDELLFQDGSFEGDASSRSDVVCELSSELAEQREFDQLMKLLQPFGQDNPEPIFLIQNARSISSESMGREGEHLKHSVKLEDGGEITVLEFFVKERVGVEQSESDSGPTPHVDIQDLLPPTLLKYSGRNLSFLRV